MEKVLLAVLASDKPRKMKQQVVKQVVSVARQQQEQPPAVVHNMLLTCKQYILETSDDFARNSCLSVYKEWARHNSSLLAEFFTTQVLQELLDVSDDSSASSAIKIIHETFYILPHNSPQFMALSRIVQLRAISWVQNHCHFLAIKTFCLLLYTYRVCIPQGIYTAKFCVSIINVVGTFSAPGCELREYVEGVSLAIGGLMQHIWKNIDDNSILQCLQAVFHIISVDSELDPSFALGGIVQHIPTRYVESAIKATVSDDKVSDRNMGAALFRMIDWLGWPMSRGLEVWIVAFLKGLGAAHKYTLLIEVTEAKIQQVCEKLEYPVVRQSALAVMSHMLLSFQHSPQPFHAVVEKIPAVVAKMKAEDSEGNGVFLVGLARLCHALIFLHGGFPDLYEPVLESIQDLPVPTTETIEQLLAASKWTASQRSTTTYLTDLTPKSLTGKAGLVNLGNTCYMNSVLQVLFMCDSFRQDVLACVAQPGQPLVAEMQKLFALLSLTQRSAFQPRKFYEASRPPWFTAGSQQDCSEYLRFILDTFHEQEKAVLSGGPPSAEHRPRSLIESTYGGKLVNTYRCLKCGSESSRLESFTDLPLAFPDETEKPRQVPSTGESASQGKFSMTGGGEVAPTRISPSPPLSLQTGINLVELLSFYFRSEKMYGDNRYDCGSCRSLQDAIRTIKIIESPVYLFLNLLRFSYNTKTQSRSKIFREVKYPKTIHLPVHGVKDGAVSQTDGDNGQGVYEGYCLCGVIVHSGLSSDGGHYYCYARHSRLRTNHSTPTENPDDVDYLEDAWYLFNDSRVSKSSYKSFSTVSSKFAKDTAYVLVYRRIQEGELLNNFQEVSIRAELREAVEKDNRAYLQEQELAQRARAAQQSQATASNFFRDWPDDGSRGGGPPGSCGGGSGFDSGPRFVC